MPPANFVPTNSAISSDASTFSRRLLSLSTLFPHTPLRIFCWQKALLKPSKIGAALYRSSSTIASCKKLSAPIPSMNCIRMSSIWRQPRCAKSAFCQSKPLKLLWRFSKAIILNFAGFTPSPCSPASESPKLHA